MKAKANEKTTREMYVRECHGKATTGKREGYYKPVRNKKEITGKAKTGVRKKYDGT